MVNYIDITIKIKELKVFEFNFKFLYNVWINGEEILSGKYEATHSHRKRKEKRNFEKCLNEYYAHQLVLENLELENLGYKKEKDIDYSLKIGDTVWFTYKNLKWDQKIEDKDWIETKILDINWAIESAAVQKKGYEGVSVTSISSLHKRKLIRLQVTKIL